MKTRIEPASDRSLLVTFSRQISIATHRKVAALTRSLARDTPANVTNVHPAYCTVLIEFDPIATDHATVQACLETRIARTSDSDSFDAALIEIPVHYGGEFGPDLEQLAHQRGLTPQQVVELHSAAEYTVYFVGFVPGFAYLGGLPPELESPRLPAPRPKVPPGSVGIAGAQTGVYPFATPGGWRLIGRTPLELFQPDRDPMSLVAIGDRVRFVVLEKPVR